MKLVPLAMVACALQVCASADALRTDPEPGITIFKDADGANVVTLVQSGWNFRSVVDAMNVKQDGKVRVHNYPNAVFAQGMRTYWVRTRLIDGKPVCEKFARRPDGDAEIEARGKELLAAPCE